MHLRKDFWEKYLRTHELYLDAISAILPYPIAETVQQIDIPTATIEQLRSGFQSDQNKSLRNMRNAWYHECAFCHPSDTDTSEWLKFAPWRIIQFYYSIYCMLSAMVRCIDASPRIGHKKMLDKFTTEIVMHPVLNQRLFVTPFCFYKGDGGLKPHPAKRITRQYALEHDFPHLEHCFENLPNRAGKPISLFHYLKSLREWANYEDSYIFMNLYGLTVREKLKWCLERILPAFLAIGENFLAAFWGSKIIQAEYGSFERVMVGTNQFDPSSLKLRFVEWYSF